MNKIEREEKSNKIFYTGFLVGLAVTIWLIAIIIYVIIMIRNITLIVG